MPGVKRRLAAAGAAAILALFAVGAGGSTAPRLTDIAPISLHVGVNSVARFAPDGRDGLVIVGWRDNGNAHGYHVFLVMLPGRRSGADCNVVGFDSGNPDGAFRDVIRDDPHTVEDAVSSVRFAHARLDGVPATLLFVASREIDPDAGIPAPSLVIFQIYRLMHNDGEVGTTADFFKKIDETRSAAKYCNAEMALSKQFQMPLTAGYRGPRTKDGCPQ